MTRILLFLILVLTFSCNSPNADTEVIHRPYPIISDDTVFNFTHSDSLQMDKVNAIFKRITIPKYWLSILDSSKYVSIHKNFLELNIIYELADSGAVLKIINVTNYPDSISFHISQGDTWTLKTLKNQKGVWVLTNPRTKKRTVIGEYISGHVN